MSEQHLLPRKPYRVDLVHVPDNELIQQVTVEAACEESAAVYALLTTPTENSADFNKSRLALPYMFTAYSAEGAEPRIFGFDAVHRFGQQLEELLSTSRIATNDKISKIIHDVAYVKGFVPPRGVAGDQRHCGLVEFIATEI